ncbi:hypothetical protein AB6A40_007023 [Gnathostoma spinigerum]|uniref:Oxaloacetate tautomerase FAHD1, mitochondrial n=1 Tax=Gnathostoma spinigerum TaxID=75299 RepID=A0ABD6ESN9_9BILA
MAGSVVDLANFRSIGKKIICVGRNYAEHAKELGNPIPKKPLIFMKSTNSYVTEGNPIVIPIGCQNLQQEVELGVVIGISAKNVLRTDAYKYIGGYTAALDMTARDFQDEAKKNGAPWYLAKSFDTSCPIAGFIQRSSTRDPHDLELFCRINGKEQQRCRTNAMLFDIPTLLEYITQFVHLEPGDLLLTGTPSGVCRVNSGDSIEFGLEGIIKATFHVQ